MSVQRGFFVVAGFLLLSSIAVAQTSNSGAAPSTSVDQIVDRTVNPYTGSLTQGKANDQILELTLEEAIARGLRYNLGLYLSRQSELQAQGARWEALAGILPKLNGELREQVQKLNLQALGIGGIKLPGFTIPTSVGPFSTSDATGTLSWNILELHSIDNVRAANENVRASNLSYRDARETVVIAVAANYLLTIAAGSRLVSARAQLDTAQSLLQLARDQEKAGLGAYIDTLRANVEVQTRQASLTEAETELEKQRIALARAIGLPVRQKFHISEQVPYKRPPEVNREDAYEIALKNRPDYLSALAQVKAAELQRKAAWEQYLPSAAFNGSYGVIGPHPSMISGQWTAAGVIQIPIFQGGKIKGQVKEADSALAERRAMAENLRDRIEQDVENSLLDLQSAAKQVDTSSGELKLANETLAQARDRFAAGVTNNIEVLQAQQSVAAANDSYISSLYAYNIAKILLSCAVGNAEQRVARYLETPGNTIPAPNPQP